MVGDVCNAGCVVMNKRQNNKNKEIGVGTYLNTRICSGFTLLNKHLRAKATAGGAHEFSRYSAASLFEVNGIVPCLGLQYHFVLEGCRISYDLTKITIPLRMNINAPIIRQGHKQNTKLAIRSKKYFRRTISVL